MNSITFIIVRTSFLIWLFGIWMEAIWI